MEFIIIFYGIDQTLQTIRICIQNAYKISHILSHQQMASFSKRIFQSLGTLTQMSQMLIVANNVQGISQHERQEVIELCASQDSKVIGAIEAFKIDRNANNLVKALKAILKTHTVQPTGEDEPILPASPAQVAPKGINIPQAGPKDAGPPASNQQGKKMPSIEEIKSKALLRKGSMKSQRAFSLRNPLQRQKSTLPEHDDLSEKDIIKLRDKLQLGKIDPRSFISRIKPLLANKDFLTKEEFTNLILDLSGSKSGFNKLKKEEVANLIFDFIDDNKNGTLDHDEILNSLVVLLGGSSESKIEAAFQIYDDDGNGLISFDEMLKHQRAVFKVMFNLKPELRQSCKETPESLALVTTESLFQEMDTNHDGVLTLAEFKAWYKREKPNAKELQDDKKDRLKSAQSAKDKIAKSMKQLRHTLTSAQRHEIIVQIKQESGIGSVHVLDALRYFQKHNTTGFFSRQQFYDILHEVLTELAGIQVNEENYHRMASNIFLMFDRDGGGVVDMGEVFSGLSILCAGNKGDKLKAASLIFDDSGDGKMQVSEVNKYFKAVFGLVVNDASLGIDVNRLAQVTAANLFGSLQLDATTDGVTYEDIKSWVDSTMNFSLQAIKVLGIRIYTLFLTYKIDFL